MQFVDDGFVPGATAPAAVLPGISVRVNYLAGTMHIVRVAAGRRVGHAQATGQSVAVAVAGPSRWQRKAVPACGIAHHGMPNRCVIASMLQ